MMLTTLELRQTSADDGHLSGHPEKAWDCGCRWHLKASREEALIAKVIYHLDVQHSEAHRTLEQAEELVATEAYDEPSLGGQPTKEKKVYAS
jgi:predicted small metal-binding protein